MIEIDETTIVVHGVIGHDSCMTIYERGGVVDEAVVARYFLKANALPQTLAIHFDQG